MQLGSGTFDVLPGIAYLGSTDRFAWGARTGAAIRLGTNDNDYRLGNAYGFTFWGGLKLTDWLSSYVRTGVQTWGNFQGADPELNPRMVPTADPLRRGGTRVPFVLGFNFFQPEGSLKGNRLTLESGWPSQSLEGPQLETDWHMRLAWQWTFLVRLLTRLKRLGRQARFVHARKDLQLVRLNPIFTAVLLSAVFCDPVAAGDMPVPIKLQVEIFGKVFDYVKTLPAETARSWSSTRMKPREYRETWVQAFQETGVTAAAIHPDQLGTQLTGATAVYISPGVPSTSASQLCRETRCPVYLGTSIVGQNR